MSTSIREMQATTRPDAEPQPFDDAALFAASLRDGSAAVMQVPEPLAGVPETEAYTPPPVLQPAQAAPVTRVETREVRVAIPPVVEFSAKATTLMRKDTAVASAVRETVEWMCDVFSTYGKRDLSFAVETPVGDIVCPIVGWNAEGTLLTILLKPGALPFTPKFGSRLAVTITDGPKKHTFGVLYGGGLLQLPGLPVVILSFLVHNDEHDQGR